MRTTIAILLAVRVVTPAAGARALEGSAARGGAVCADHPNQAAAQRAADTIDADRDGIYCESLPCPCLAPGEEPAPAEPTPTPAPKQQRIVRPARAGGRAAVLQAQVPEHPAPHGARDPQGLAPGAGAQPCRRGRAETSCSKRSQPRPGMDRDEYPPAVGRGRGKGLVRGSSPRGWRADIAYVPSGENRSHGSLLGNKLRRYCDGTKFRYVFK